MTTTLVPCEHDDGTSFPKPRPFQIKAHESLREGFTGGHKNQIIMAPTGAGKTYIGLNICNEATRRGKKAVFLCDRTIERSEWFACVLCEVQSNLAHGSHRDCCKLLEVHDAVESLPQCRCVTQSV